MKCENKNTEYFTALEGIPISMERLKLALEIPNYIKSITMNMSDYIKLAELCGFSIKDYKEFATKYKISLCIQANPGAVECGFPNVEIWGVMQRP